MKPDIPLVNRIFDGLERHISEVSIEYDKEYINKTLSHLYSPGPSFQYILDINTRRFDYVSESVKDVLGFNSQNFTLQDYADLVCSEDLDYVVHCEKLIEFFLFEFIDKSERLFYKHIYPLRMRNSLNQSNLYLRQTISISADDQYRISKVFTNQSKIDHITSVKNGTVSFIDIRGHRSYFNIRTKSDLINPSPVIRRLTNREIEILKLLSEGFSSKEIANRLFISYNTVRTHRNNILKKTKCFSINQVIGKYIKKGVI